MVKMYEVRNLYEINRDLKKNKAVLYGCSYSGVMLYHKLKTSGIDVIGFIDSFEHEANEFCGKPILDMEELQKLDMSGAATVVSTVNHKYQIEILERLERYSIKNVYIYGINYGPYEYDTMFMKELIKNGEEKITCVFNHLKDQTSRQVFMNLVNYRLTNDKRLLELSFENNHPQYFPDSDIMLFTDSEVFVDAGAYNGDTFLQFIRNIHMGGHSFSGIYAFEPDETMYLIAATIAKLQSQKDLIEVYPYALYNKRTQISFSGDCITGSSMIDGKGLDRVETITLDEILKDRKEKVTYIKMDVEGSEIEAMDGSKEIITKDHPKLAISIYHNPEDLWEIPYKILKEYPGYRIHIRHYTDITTETVCYAVFEG